MAARGVIGIVGGMGPHAGIELARLCVTLADCSQDQDHPDLLLVSRPARTPDRTEFVTGRSNDNPSNAILAVACELADAGATAIGVACNTSHVPSILGPVRYEFSRLFPACTLHSLVDAGAAAAVRAAHGRSVGLLATEGTYLTKIYDTALTARGVHALVPAAATRSRLHRAIYDAEWGIKSKSAPVDERAEHIMNSAIDELVALGAASILLGCTELPLASHAVGHSLVPTIDPMRELATVLLIAVGCTVRVPESTSVTTSK